MLVTKIRDSRELEDCLEGTWRPFEEWGGGGGRDRAVKGLRPSTSLTHSHAARSWQRAAPSKHPPGKLWAWATD